MDGVATRLAGNGIGRGRVGGERVGWVETWSMGFHYTFFVVWITKTWRRGRLPQNAPFCYKTLTRDA
jgi:hypothetical protein